MNLLKFSRGEEVINKEQKRHLGKFVVIAYKRELNRSLEGLFS
jgi:hypothetical protein